MTEPSRGHIVRDLMAPGADAARIAHAGRLVRFGHLTDLHILDIDSPCRFEFFTDEHDDPRFALLVPTRRLQDALTADAAAGAVASLNRIDGLDLVLVTGDAIDNAQRNELDRFLQVMRALRVPWLGCYGNHEATCQGVGRITPELAAAYVGARKVVSLSPAIDRDAAAELFASQPELFLQGDGVAVEPDPRRRPVTRGEVAAELPSGSTQYSHDLGPVRFVVLDTVNVEGGAGGRVDSAGVDWLRAELAGAGHRLVVLASHHCSEAIDGGAAVAAAMLEHPRAVLWINGHIHRHWVRPHRRPTGTGFWEVTTGSLIDWPCQQRVFDLLAGDGLVGIRSSVLDLAGGAAAQRHLELAAADPLAGRGRGLEGLPEDRDVLLLLPDPR